MRGIVSSMGVLALLAWAMFGGLLLMTAREALEPECLMTGLPDGADGMLLVRHQPRHFRGDTGGSADISQIARDRLSTEMNNQTHEPGRFWARRLP